MSASFSDTLQPGKAPVNSFGSVILRAGFTIVSISTRYSLNWRIYMVKKTTGPLYDLLIPYSAFPIFFSHLHQLLAKIWISGCYNSLWDGRRTYMQCGRCGLRSFLAIYTDLDGTMSRRTSQTTMLLAIGRVVDSSWSFLELASTFFLKNLTHNLHISFATEWFVDVCNVPGWRRALSVRDTLRVFIQ